MKPNTPRGKKPKKPEILPPEPKRPEKREDSDDLDAEFEINAEETAEVLSADSAHSDEETTEEIGGLPATSQSDYTKHEIPDKDLKAISPADPLRRYLEELRAYPLLSPEEEFTLAMRLKDSGDLEAAKRLVQANLRLVVKIAFEYRNFYSNVLDLVQEGNIGLMKAVSKFDPTKGARLGYYSSWWIRSYILKYILDNFRLVKIGTTQAQKKLFYHLLREKERLESQGLLAGPKLLAEKLDVREKDIVEMSHRLSSAGNEMPLDAPREGDEGGKMTLQGTIADSRELPDEALVREQLLKLLEGKLPQFQKKLNDKELKILNERLLSESPKTLQEVADQYGLTRERARQIEAKVIQKLREFLKPFLGND